VAEVLRELVDATRCAMSWMPDVVAGKPRIINVEVPGDGDQGPVAGVTHLSTCDSVALS
jgi:hypothetical protein